MSYRPSMNGTTHAAPATTHAPEEEDMDSDPPPTTSAITARLEANEAAIRRNSADVQALQRLREADNVQQAGDMAGAKLTFEAVGEAVKALETRLLAAFDSLRLDVAPLIESRSQRDVLRKWATRAFAFFAGLLGLVGGGIKIYETFFSKGH